MKGLEVVVQGCRGCGSVGSVESVWILGYKGLKEQFLDLVVPFDRLVANNFAALLNEYNRQESIPVGCILNVCVDYTCFNGHQMSALGSS